MGYTNLYFNKTLSEISFDDVEHFFSEEREESDKIEFKSYVYPEEKNDTEKLNSIVRTICGLLNSEGGLIIWGAPKGQSVVNKKEKIFKGGLTPLDKLIEKDSFLSKVTDLITPSPKGIVFQMLAKDGKYVYLIEVAQSLYPPHQFKNTYFMRIDGQTKPAPHHYIEALFRKVTFPKLEGYIKIEKINIVDDKYHITFSWLIFNKSKLQNEHEVYFRIIISIGEFIQWKYRGVGYKRITNSGQEITALNAKPTLYYNEPLIETDTLEVSFEDLLTSNSSIRILLHFGGKNSPLMVSKYNLRLDIADSGNPNSIIKELEENIYSYENSDRINNTDEENLKILLGR